MLVFDLSLGVLYINQEAQALNTQLITTRGDVPAMDRMVSGVAPMLANDLLHLSEEVAQQLRLRADTKEWGQVYIRRTFDHHGCPLVLQAFGIPDAGSNGRSVVILLLERRKPLRDREITQQIAQAKERFQLTDREQAVAEYLARGLTNKEIACTLGITEQTIKVHVKHIMEKTESPTRTAVLAQLFQRSALSEHPYASTFQRGNMLGCGSSDTLAHRGSAEKTASGIPAVRVSDVMKS